VQISFFLKKTPIFRVQAAAARGQGLKRNQSSCTILESNVMIWAPH